MQWDVVEAGPFDVVVVDPVDGIRGRGVHQDCVNARDTGTLHVSMYLPPCEGRWGLAYYRIVEYVVPYARFDARVRLR